MLMNCLYISDSAGKGKGVFTNEVIPPNIIVEISPVIVMSAEERKFLDQTKLHDYIFIWGADNSQCCMALGYIAIYNHSYASNCEYFMDFEDSTMMVKTVREIKAGEELTINYNGDWNDEKQVWFDAQ
ncbi:MAG: SET domain-containing protein-lysine N-methyltransferase [Chitinophagaceae bacterium]|nr:MAG: SET domain-containing protein-lysine N-methyltransferase [Chitinophagaceae bacterium]